METTLTTPTTLQEAVIFFAKPDNCHAFMMNLRWPNGRLRGGSDNVADLPNSRVFKCYEKHACQKFSLKVGTIFERSPLGLDKWLPAMWMLSIARMESAATNSPRHGSYAKNRVVHAPAGAAGFAGYRDRREAWR